MVLPDTGMRLPQRAAVSQAMVVRVHFWISEQQGFPARLVTLPIGSKVTKTASTCSRASHSLPQRGYCWRRDKRVLLTLVPNWAGARCARSMRALFQGAQI